MTPHYSFPPRKSILKVPDTVSDPFLICYSGTDPYAPGCECLDRDGNIIATNGWEMSGPGGMITVFSPTGRVLETHLVPANRPTNCCFGGPDLTTLFVTTVEGHFFKVQTDRVGWAMYP